MNIVYFLLCIIAQAEGKNFNIVLLKQQSITFLLSGMRIADHSKLKDSNASFVFLFGIILD